MDEKAGISTIREALFDNSNTKDTKQSVSGSITLNGSQSIAIGDHATINITHIVKGTGSSSHAKLTPNQSSRFTYLVSEIVAAGRRSGLPISHEAVWADLDEHFNVSSNGSLTANEFQAATSYLQSLYYRVQEH